MRSLTISRVRESLASMVPETEQVRVGVEVGGTFTDLLSVTEDGVRFAKVPSVPVRPDDGVYAALTKAAILPGEIAELVHGSTVVTNAILERRGAAVAFVTTEGFRDLLFLQRHNRDRVFDVAYQKPRPLVPRRACFEVRERMLADGTVAVPLEEGSIERNLIPALAKGGYRAVAICLLNAYVNPLHEERISEMLKRHLPEIVVTLSSDVAREFREYERASTTVMAAYVRTVVASYLTRLEGFLAEHQFRGQFSIMQSNGGRIPAAAMRQNPMTALFSGPAAGVMAAIRQAGRAGHRDLITFDMGGTSTDVCLVQDGTARLTSQTMMGRFPVRTTLFDIATIGAGCGSVVWVDAGGMLRIGPMSTGADPGPACYGRGGDQPTVTDAHVVRGTLRPQAFLGGDMEIDAAASHRVLVGLGARLGMNAEEMAISTIRLTEASIVQAIQVVSTQRGHDPRDFVLVAFGGAGPLHAARVAEELGIETVVIPPFAGVLSAYGLLSADYRFYETVTHRHAVEEQAPAEVLRTFRNMRQRATERLRELGLPLEQAVLSLTLEMRFVGQAFEVAVHLDADALPRLTTQSLMKAFIEAHEREYLHGTMNRQAVEIITYRLGASVPGDDLALTRLRQPQDTATFKKHRIIDVDGAAQCRLGPRSAIDPGETISGPAVLEDVTSTVYVPADWRAETDKAGNLVMRRKAAP